MRAKEQRSAADLRRRVYDILNHGMVGDRVTRTVAQLIILLIVVNLVAVTLESVPDLASKYGALFGAIEVVSLALFTAEYALRLWVAVDHPPFRHLGPHRDFPNYWEQLLALRNHALDVFRWDCNQIRVLNRP